MRKFVAALLVLVLVFGYAYSCSTLTLLFPLTYDLSSTIASDFLRRSNGKEALFFATTYITENQWEESAMRWVRAHPNSGKLTLEATRIDVYFRAALLECHGIDLGGERYSPPWYLSGFYKSMLSEGCICFDELTESKFSE